MPKVNTRLGVLTVGIFGIAGRFRNDQGAWVSCTRYFNEFDDQLLEFLPLPNELHS